MNIRPATRASSSITRRESLLTVLGTAMALAGCGGGGVGGGAAVANGGGAVPGSGSAVSGTGSVVSGTGEAPLMVSNNEIVVFGDSRSANATQYSNTTATNRGTADSYIGYAMIASNFRGDFTGNYAVNSDKLQDMLGRLGPTAQTRGQLLSATPGVSAGIVIFMGGVNDAASPISATGPLYQSILQKLADAGKTVIVCNEVPSNTTGSAATEQVAAAWTR